MTAMPGAPSLWAEVTWRHVLLFVATALTTTLTGTMWAGIEPTSTAAFLSGLPYSLTLMAILLTHEAGHWVMCQRHRVSASLPYFLPAPPTLSLFGTFGAFIRIRARFPHRRALFDIGAGGPWAGFVVALTALAVGLRLSTVLPTPPSGHVIELGDSLLTAALTRLLLGVDPATVQLHPIAFAGWFGLFVTSLNLLPVGQLDGGHVLYAAAGRRTRLVPAILIATLAWLGWRGWTGWLVWAAILAILYTLGHPPTQDDWEPLDSRRRFGAVASLALLAATFVAEPFRFVP